MLKEEQRIKSEIEKKYLEEGGPKMIKEERPKKHPHLPIPPHERKDLKIDFKQDEELLKEIFGDNDTAKAVVDIITTSPTEIQIVLKVVINLYNKVNESKGE